MNIPVNPPVYVINTYGCGTKNATTNAGIWSPKDHKSFFVLVISGPASMPKS